MNTRISPTRASVALASAVAFLGAGCGTHTKSAGPPASATPVPWQSPSAAVALLPTEPAATPSTSPSVLAISPSATLPSASPPVSQVVVSVYLVSTGHNAGHIAASHRVVPGPAVARAAVEALLAGPTETDAAFGYVSKIPSNVHLSGLTMSDATARLSLTGPTTVPAAGIAQLVCTLSQFGSVDRVALSLNGGVLTIPGAGASLTRSDVEAVLPVVLVESPTVGETVHTPVRVVGSANTFEAVFRLQVTDWDGLIVADVVVHAASGTGTRGAFDATIPFTVNRAGIGELIVSYDSPKDGSRVVVAEIPLHVST